MNLQILKNPEHPDHRPPYLHLIPLAEIIQMALGHASVQTKGVQTAWNTLVERFGNEVEALIYSEPEALKIVDDRIVNAILAFRKGNVIIHPGGGGQYGWLELPETLKVENPRQDGQISFSDLEKINSGKKKNKKPAKEEKDKKTKELEQQAKGIRKKTKSTDSSLKKVKKSDHTSSSQEIKETGEVKKQGKQGTPEEKEENKEKEVLYNSDGQSSLFDF